MHITKDCKNMLRKKIEEIEVYNSTISQNKYNQYNCFYCNQKGHIFKSCPAKIKDEVEHAQGHHVEIAEGNIQSLDKERVDKRGEMARFVEDTNASEFHTFYEFVAFLNLIKNDDIISKGWDIYRKRFDKFEREEDGRSNWSENLQTKLMDVLCRQELWRSMKSVALEEGCDAMQSQLQHWQLSIFSLSTETRDSLLALRRPRQEATNKSKGYGFVTFKHVDGAVKALVEPSKKIDGRITVARLASARGVVNNNNVENRKVYVGNVPWEVGIERLLECFSAFGEIEEGPLGFEKQSGRAKGFAFFVYKSEEGARKAVVDSVMSIDGYQVMCKMAVDAKKGRAGGGMMPSRGPVPGIVNTDGRTSYSGYPDRPSMLPRQNPPPSGTGSGQGSYIAGTGYNSGGSSTVAAAAPEYHGQNNYGPSVNRWPPAQGGYADGGNYAPSSGYPTQLNMTPAGPRGPHARMYHGGHRDYQGEERARRAVVDSAKCIDGHP
nr:hypothetical protein [Tanacetum cinerariifolium]